MPACMQLGLQVAGEKLKGDAQMVVALEVVHDAHDVVLVVNTARLTGIGARMHAAWLTGCR